MTDYHRDYAEQILENVPVNELTGRHSPTTALAHALIALVDKLDTIPVLRVFMEDDEEDDDDDDDDS